MFSADGRARRGFRVAWALAALSGALTLSSFAAAADVPAGFVSRPGLAQRAAFVAGKPVTVLCAPDQATWDAEEATLHGSRDAVGHTDGVGGTTIYLAPVACDP